MRNKHILIAIIIIYMQLGCKKLVDVSAPATGIAGNSVYNADATSIAVMTGIYASFSSSPQASFGSIPSLTLATGLSSDEFTLWSGSLNLTAQAYYKNSLSGSTDGYGQEYWALLYPYIFTCNEAIEGVTNSATLTPSIKQQLLGEAKFMRAFLYFYLVNLYGDIPLPLTGSSKVNALLPRVSTNQVYKQIIADLQDAENLLSNTYLDATLLNSTVERVRPTKWAAAALLARTYLYTGDWSNAERQATEVIGNSTLFTLSPLPNTFLKASLGNNEAIWQLQPVNAGWNTEDAKTFIIPDAGPGSGLNFGAYLSTFSLNAFEPEDQRRFNANWVDSVIVGSSVYYYPYKYKINTFGAAVNEYFTVLRLGETYLIRAEARAKQGNTAGAAADLNTIRNRAGLGSTLAFDQASLITAIFHERQVELFAELGHRWFDLKRTSSVDSVMKYVTPQKSNGAAWKSYQQLYPVNYTDIQLDPNLSQNNGYN